MTQETHRDHTDAVPLADPVARAPRGRPLRMAPRDMGAHPGRGLALEPGWQYAGGEFSGAVVAKAREMSTLRPDSLTVLVDIVNKCNLRCIMCHFSFDEVF